MKSPDHSEPPPQGTWDARAKTLTLETHTQLSNLSNATITLGAGNIEVQGTHPDAPKILRKTVVKARTKRGARRRLRRQQAKITMEQTSTGVNVREKTRQTPLSIVDRFLGRRARTDVTVLAPNSEGEYSLKTSGTIVGKHVKGSISAKTDKGAITLFGIHGNVSAETRHGSIGIHGLHGSVEVFTNSGSVNVHGADIGGRSMIQTDSGRVQATVTNKNLTVFATTNDGTITTEGPTVRAQATNR